MKVTSVGTDWLSMVEENTVRWIFKGENSEGQSIGFVVERSSERKQINRFVGF